MGGLGGQPVQLNNRFIVLKYCKCLNINFFLSGYNLIGKAEKKYFAHRYKKTVHLIKVQYICTVTIKCTIMVFGYIRVSKTVQNTDLQKDALKKYGCDRIFSEKLSGARKDRPEYEKMTALLREGDTVVVWRIDRLGRTTLELIKLMVELRERGIHFVSDTEGINTKTPMGKIWFMLNAVMAENEREVNIERTRAGLASARARGRMGGRPAGLSDKAKKKAAIATSLYKEGKMSTMEIINSLNIKSKATLYSYLRKSGVVIKSWTDDGSGTKTNGTNETENTQAIKSEPSKKNSAAKPKAPQRLSFKNL